MLKFLKSETPQECKDNFKLSPWAIGQEPSAYLGPWGKPYPTIEPESEPAAEGSIGSLGSSGKPEGNHQ